MLSQRQANAMLSMKPTVIYNPDVYRKRTNLFFLRNYCILIKSPPPQWDVWLFQANAVCDTSQNWCWFRGEQIETGNSSVAKISNSSGVKLLMRKIALTVMMLFCLFLRLQVSFTSSAPMAAVFPSTTCPVLCSLFVAADVQCCACANVLKEPYKLHQRTSEIKTKTQQNTQTNEKHKNHKQANKTKTPKNKPQAHGLFIMQALFSVICFGTTCWSKLQIIKYRSRPIELTFTSVYSVMSM